MHKKQPREILRDLLRRSGLSMTAIAKLAGYKSPSGLNKYELPAFGDKLIPHHVIKELIPILVGRGTPPITHDELIAISTMGSELARAPARPLVGSVKWPLPTLYRVEAGVFMDDASRERKKLGNSVIFESDRYPAEGQWAATGLDENDTEVTLHCVDLDQVLAHRRNGRRCVAKVTKEGTNLSEIVLTRFKADGTAEKGVALGVVIGVYKPE